MRENITKLRVYSGKEKVYNIDNINAPEISLEIPLSDLDIKNFIRVEVEGIDSH